MHHDTIPEHGDAKVEVESPRKCIMAVSRKTLAANCDKEEEGLVPTEGVVRGDPASEVGDEHGDEAPNLDQDKPLGMQVRGGAGPSVAAMDARVVIDFMYP
ncbi:hypothetical protein MLD38_017367 [Melastoma candidum]|uniref:Uncharacterized protein n=1 Tax=Melastoma candidum TaxID=119954 RepID=A0ACB9QQF2_9MYRT|nr:hypothetical protein MLD38_017367 [Melastoma candidum]